MELIGVIPSRYASTRFPGKPLAKICGKPMIWWVYNSAIQVRGLDKVYVAVDDERIAYECEKYDIPTVMTKNTHMNCFYRVYEVLQKVCAQRCIMINGDEPLIEPSCIQAVTDEFLKTKAHYLFSYRTLKDPVETMDTGNIKVVVSGNKLIYLSRIPIPCPHKTALFNYKKIIGIQGLSIEALDFFVNTAQGELERIEDIAELRWLENGKTVNCIEIVSDSVSVDNPRDIEKVTQIMNNRIQIGHI